VTSTAGDPTINGHRSRFRFRFRFNDVIKGVAARAIEMNGLIFGHDIRAPTHWPRVTIADRAAPVAAHAAISKEWWRPHLPVLQVTAPSSRVE
jgi:hypothetical protein